MLHFAFTFNRDNDSTALLAIRSSVDLSEDAENSVCGRTAENVKRMYEEHKENVSCLNSVQFAVTRTRVRPYTDEISNYVRRDIVSDHKRQTSKCRLVNRTLLFNSLGQHFSHSTHPGVLP